MPASFRPRSRSVLLAWSGLAAALWLVSPAARAEQPAAASPSSREILKRMSDVLAAAEHLRFHAELNFDSSLGDGLMVQVAGAVDTALSRPNGLRVDYRDDASSKLLWYDGKTVTLLDRADGLVAQEPALATLDATIVEYRKRYGLELPLAPLLASNLFQMVSPQLEAGAYLGVHDADGIPCDHIAFAGPKHDFELWVERGERPLLRKLLMRSRDLRGAPQYSALFTEWDLDAKFPATEFVAEIPESAVPIEFVVKDPEVAK